MSSESGSWKDPPWPTAIAYEQAKAVTVISPQANPEMNYSEHMVAASRFLASVEKKVTSPQDADSSLDPSTRLETEEATSSGKEEASLVIM